MEGREGTGVVESRWVRWFTLFATCFMFKTLFGPVFIFREPALVCVYTKGRVGCRCGCPLNLE